MKKLYIGCSLRNAPKPFIDEVYRIRETTKEEFEVLEFLGLDSDTPKNIYKYDINCVRSCDVMLAICDLPSIGLGIEINTANSLGTPVLALAQEDSLVSSMVIGNNSVNFLFKRYEKIDDIPEMLSNFVKNLPV